MQICYGTRKAMQAEYGTLEAYPGRYLVQPIASLLSYDADGFNTKKEALAYAKELAAFYGAPISFVG